jgi:hypothetical protein
MKKYFNYSFLLPLCFFLLSVAVAHGGNDKAPFLVLMAAFYSFVTSGVYFLSALFKKPRKENLKKSLISGAPFLAVVVLFALARADIIDTLPILGFR